MVTKKTAISSRWETLLEIDMIMQLSRTRGRKTFNSSYQSQVASLYFSIERLRLTIANKSKLLIYYCNSKVASSLNLRLWSESVATIPLLSCQFFFLLSSNVLRVDLISRSIGSVLDGAFAILCLSNFMVFRPLPLAVTIDTVVQNKAGLWELNSSTCVLSRSYSLLFFRNNSTFSILSVAVQQRSQNLALSCSFGRKMYFLYALHHN